MSASRIGEPLIPDERVAKCERVVRAMIPGIPEESVFATYVQERGPASAGGKDFDMIPEVAVFFIQSPNPRHEGFTILDKGGCWLKVWKSRDREFRNNVGVTDPAVSIFSILAQEHVKKLANLRAMTNPVVQLG